MAVDDPPVPPAAGDAIAVTEIVLKFVPAATGCVKYVFTEAVSTRVVVVPLMVTSISTSPPDAVPRFEMPRLATTVRVNAEVDDVDGKPDHVQSPRALVPTPVLLPETVAQLVVSPSYALVGFVVVLDPVSNDVDGM